MISLVIMHSCGTFSAVCITYDSQYEFQAKMNQEAIDFQNHVMAKYDLDYYPEISYADVSRDPTVMHFFNNILEFSDN